MAEAKLNDGSSSEGEDSDCDSAEVRDPCLTCLFMPEEVAEQKALFHPNDVRKPGAFFGLVGNQLVREDGMVTMQAKSTTSALITAGKFYSVVSFRGSVATLQARTKDDFIDSRNLIKFKNENVSRVYIDHNSDCPPRVTLNLGVPRSVEWISSPPSTTVTGPLYLSFVAPCGLDGTVELSNGATFKNISHGRHITRHD